MSTAALPAAETPASLTERTEAAAATLDHLLNLAAQRVRDRVSEDGRISSRLMEEEQRATHGLAWFATYVESLRQLDAYAKRLTAEGRYGALEDYIVQLGFAEYLAQIFGGIPMNQGEVIRPVDFEFAGDTPFPAIAALYSLPMLDGESRSVGEVLAGKLSGKPQEGDVARFGTAAMVVLETDREGEILRAGLRLDAPTLKRRWRRVVERMRRRFGRA